MKKILIPLAGALIIACLPDLAGGQILLEENFEYTAGTALTSNGWTAHSGGGTNPITVSSGSLSYPDYLSSGIGNAAWLDGEGEDVHRDFTSQTSGTLYLARAVITSFT
jgi:hypothetical protein